MSRLLDSVALALGVAFAAVLLWTWAGAIPTGRVTVVCNSYGELWVDGVLIALALVFCTWRLAMAVARWWHG